MLSRDSEKATLCCMLLLCFQCNCKIFGVTNDQSTSRPNTLFDDADDIQRQLDNEVRDRFGQFKTVWVFHVPTRINMQKSLTSPNDIVVRLKRKPNNGLFNIYKTTTEPEEMCHCGDIEDPGGTCTGEKNAIPEWHFWDQDKWKEHYKDCAGHAQSPVILPVEGLIHARGARKLIFSNYDVRANNLTVVNDGKRVVMYGNWPKYKWPLVYGGAAHSRRYLFHSLSVYWPSEHPVGGLYYPLETQLLHISAEYNSFEEAIKASSKDKMAFLGVVNIYKYSKYSHPGIMMILQSARKHQAGKANLRPVSLSNFSAPFRDHVCYYGSLTTPPCTESVLWLIRRRSLPISRHVTDTLHHILGPAATPSVPTGDAFTSMTVRVPQPLNDRKVFVLD